MIQTLVFSRNRAAQLDLLLRSIKERAPALFQTTEVLFTATNSDYQAGYNRLASELWAPPLLLRREHSFQKQVGDFLESGTSAHVAFLCDDDVVMRPHTSQPTNPEVFLDETPELLTFSLRLGENTTNCYPTRKEQRSPAILERFRDTIFWSWPNAYGDWGYPGSLDGHIFRRHQVIELLAGMDYTNPNRLEDVLANRCFGRDTVSPLMASYTKSLITGVPVNRVNIDYPNRYGDTHPLPTAELNAKYLEGHRLKLPEFENINAAHVELPLVFA